MNEKPYMAKARKVEKLKHLPKIGQNELSLIHLSEPFTNNVHNGRFACIRNKEPLNNNEFNNGRGFYMWTHNENLVPRFSAGNFLLNLK